jgi:RimJ/RimL family protein N-acetyltransferase
VVAQVDSPAGALTCRRGLHVLELPRLRFQTPAGHDLAMMAAAGSDPAAQRWLGWAAGQVVRESHREALLTMCPGSGRPYRGRANGAWHLLVIDRRTGRVAGAVGVQADHDEVGGWLAPAFRSRGLGGELFTGAALFGHHLRGSSGVRAGTETANVACVVALAAAGFVPVPGPEAHDLADGRVVPTRWFRHDAQEPPTRCRTASGWAALTLRFFDLADLASRL